MPKLYTDSDGSITNIIDLTGNKFNNLTVLRYSYLKDHKVFWDVKCDCGKELTVYGSNLKNGNTKSCGCLHREKTVTHGMARTPIYLIWGGIIQRCTNKNDNHYPDYGGRGITVCDKWLTFEGFYEDMGDRPKGLTVDRKDNNGNYCKENCYWATRMEQANNRRGNTYIEFNGERHTIAEWGRLFNKDPKLIRTRIFKHNWSVEKALTTDKRKRCSV